MSELTLRTPVDMNQAITFGNYHEIKTAVTSMAQCFATQNKKRHISGWSCEQCKISKVYKDGKEYNKSNVTDDHDVRRGRHFPGE